jgi:DNA repair protein RadA/Sms
MKTKVMYTCTECGTPHARWQGFCNNCQARGTLEEQQGTGGIKAGNRQTIKKNAISTKRLADTQAQNSDRIVTSFGEFNRVMGGGIVKDSLSIITAQPGAGKSTLLLQIAQDVAKQGMRVLYASGEESESQIRRRADRVLAAIDDGVYVYADNSMNNVLGAVDDVDPDVIIIDSIQTFVLDEFPARPGTPTQTMECANALLRLAKDAARPRAVILVGQMTKENELAGIRALEHLVDTVLVLDGEDGEELKQLAATKNRYGSTGEMGFFTMTEQGLVPIDNPSEYFMTLREAGEEVYGSALTVVKEGTRPIILEIESLVSPTYTPYPTRIGESLKKDQLNTLISIIEQRAGVELYTKNVIIKTTGGFRLKENSSNLAVIMSILSSAKKKAIPSDSVFIADIGLTGELKKVPTLEARIRELERMGFKKVYVAKEALRASVKFSNIQVIARNTLADVVRDVFMK